MLGTSPEFRDAVRAPHQHVARVEVLRDGAVIRTLDVHGGSVDADRSNRILRRFEATVADPTGELTPGDMRDLLAPFGTEVRLYRGARIPVITDATDVDATPEQWAEGEHINTIAHSSGDLVLGV
jgi:hypothetical protein